MPAVRSKEENILDRSEAKKNYKQAKRPMGVYRIRNTLNGKSYVGFSTDLPARLSRHKAELKFGSHRNTELLSDWKLFGESCFEFEVLDELEYEENSKANPAEELGILTEIWIRKLEKEGSSVVGLS
jgi:group I intron endonuclease